jgi:Putative auto-transporter adhesin, head GIN domain
MALKRLNGRRGLQTAWGLALLMAMAGGCTAGGGGKGDAKVGSGIPLTQDRSAVVTGKEVKGVRLETSGRVEIRRGPTASVAVKVDDNLEELIVTEVKGDDLVISARGEFTSREGLEVVVTLPDLDDVELAGSGEIVLKDVDVASLELEVSGSGMVTAGGTAESLKAVVSGSGRIAAGRMKAKAVTAEVSGSGEIEVDAAERLEATVSGSGLIRYSGGAKDVKTSVTGSGTIVPK